MTIEPFARLIEIIDVDNQLGEGVLWRSQDSTVWWTDIEMSVLYKLEWPSLKLSKYLAPERIGSFGFVSGALDKLIVAFETGFAFFWPYTGQCQWLSRSDELCAGRRLNDGRVGPDGRFWAGSMIEVDDPKLDVSDTGLYSVGSGGKTAFERGGLQISNGICWSPDGSILYYSDSLNQTIYHCKYDTRTGRLGEQKVLITLRNGHPDGAVVDREGNIWSAIWGAAKLMCISPHGKILRELEVPALQPTCLVFGGKGRNLMFVTTATQNLSKQELKAYPYSGSLLIYQGEQLGLGITSFKL